LESQSLPHHVPDIVIETDLVFQIEFFGREALLHFRQFTATGRASATVTGLDDGKDHTFRLWLRSGQMELYIDDLLMQSFFYFKATGRIGFIAQESEVDFSKLRFYSMNP
jgi:hypothetical protein